MRFVKQTLSVAVMILRATISKSSLSKVIIQFTMISALDYKRPISNLHFIYLSSISLQLIFLSVLIIGNFFLFQFIFYFFLKDIYYLCNISNINNKIPVFCCVFNVYRRKFPAVTDAEVVERDRVYGLEMLIKTCRCFTR